MSARGQVSRDDEIVKARMRGMTWPTIADRFGLTERRCQQIWSGYRDSYPTARERGPMELLDDILDAYEVAREDLAVIIAESTHDATRVAAVRSNVAIAETQAELLIALGVMPTVEHLRQEVNVRQTAARIMAVLEEYDVSEDMLAAMHLAVTGREMSAMLALDGADAD